jgi:hypothetical protein
VETYALLPLHGFDAHEHTYVLRPLEDHPDPFQLGELALDVDGLTVDQHPVAIEDHQLEVGHRL